MPRKKKVNPNLSFDLIFSDITMIESSGVYKEFKKILDKEEICPQKAVVKTNLNILHPLGEARIKLDFYYNKKVYITGYMSNDYNIFNNLDIRCLSAWCQKNGWKMPEPTESVIRENMDFWKKAWEFSLVESEFLDEKYGKREIMDDDDEED